mgnify:CR=1 FL=1
MKAAEIKALFPTEAALCARLIDCLTAAGGWEIYPETAGFDILAVWKATGHQLGVEAKLQLNSKVADQILPRHWDSGSHCGPDFRAVLVPCTTAANHGIARMLDALGVRLEVIAGALSTCSRQRLVLGQLLGEDTATILPTTESTENPFTQDAYPAERV